jgi:hypothetical protein
MPEQPLPQERGMAVTRLAGQRPGLERSKSKDANGWEHDGQVDRCVSDAINEITALRKRLGIPS